MEDIIDISEVESTESEINDIGIEPDFVMLDNNEEKCVSESELVESIKFSSTPFDCNICLDPVSDPVVTLCGHLYCWQCLYKWLEPGMIPEERERLGVANVVTVPNFRRRCCPVCKAECSVNKIIPIYIKNDQVVDHSTDSLRNSTNASSSAENATSELRNPIPSRPLPPPQQPSSQNLNTSLLLQNNSVEMQYSLFSALFGVQQPFAISTSRNDNAASSPEDASSEYLSRLLLVLGSFVVLCLLVF